MKVYFISGLAADEHVFKYIALPQGFEAVHLRWIRPLENESLSGYAGRLASPIDRGQPFIIIGLSLGGMLAIEIAKILKPVKVIIISSVPSAAHLPFYFRTAGQLKLHKLVPVSLLKSLSLIKRFFSPESSEDKEYLRRAIRDSDPVFIRWVVNAILTWEEKDPLPCIHIHGTKDLLLPARYTKAGYLIPGGGHLMILNKSAEINEVIRKELSPVDTRYQPSA